jgi:hypothetical protein
MEWLIPLQGQVVGLDTAPLIYFIEQNEIYLQPVRDFKAGDNINVSCFARSIRHVFAHGVLSANSTGLSPKRFNQLSLIISNFLLDCTDQDFDRRVP